MASDIEIIYEIPTVDPAASLESARRALRDSRTLRPDQRFLLAAAEIKRLAGDRPPFRIYVAREGDGWRLHSDGVSIGTLPILPDFQQARRLLVGWATARLSPVVRSGAAHPEIDDLERAASDPFTDGPVVTLGKIDELWKTGSRHGSLLRVASTASRSLLAQGFDRVGMTDRLDAKALAYLASAEAVEGPDPEGGAFLARWIGYPAEADLLAGSLPAASPMRIWVEDRSDELQRHAEGSAASPFVRYLFLLRLAAVKDLKAWAAWVDAHPQHVVEGLPLIRTALNASDFGPDRENAELMLYVLEIEMGGTRAPPSVWKDLRRGLLESRVGRSVAQLISLFARTRPRLEGIVARFEKLLERRVPASGIFWDPELARTHYRALFYSSLYTLGMYELDRRASVRSAEAFAETLKDAPPGPGDAFALWFSDLVLFEKDQSRVDLLLQDFGTAEMVGRHAVRRIADDLLRVIPANDPRSRSVPTEWGKRLDTRPYERTLHGSNCYAYLGDLPCYETYYGTGVSGLGRHHQGTEVAWANYRNDGAALRRYAASAPKASDRWTALVVLADKSLATEEELVAQSERIFSMDAEASGTHGRIAEFLRDRGRFREAEKLLRQQIANHPEDHPLTAAYYAALLSAALRGQGRAEEAWKVIEPWIETWKGDALAEGAEVLDALGRQDEALELARRGLERYPTGPYSRATLARILWRQGRHAEVPKLYQDPKHPPAPFDWQNHIAHSFREVFQRASMEDISPAFEPMLAAKFNFWYLMTFAESFAEIERFDVALALLLRITATQPHIGPLDPRFNVYRYLAWSKGEAEAAAWVRANVPAAARPAVMETSLIYGLFPLFWQAAEMGSDTKEEEDVWLMQATAAVLDPDAPAARIERVRSHFRESTDPQAVFGRLLLGLSGSGAEEAIPADPSQRARGAYYRAIQAAAAGNSLDAADWFLLCVELQRVRLSDRVALREENRARSRADKFLDRALREGRPIAKSAWKVGERPAAGS